MAYRGFTARLPIGQLGFTGTQNPSQAQPGHFVFVDGAELEGGLIRKEGGAIKLNSTPLGGAIVSGINWSPLAAVTRDVVFLSNGSVLRDDGSGTFATTLVSGLTNQRDPPPWFLPCGGESVGDARLLFMFSAANQVQVLAGDSLTMAPIATPPADWAATFPTFGTLHSGRVFAGGNASDPHRIYYSTLTDHEDFTGAGSGTFAIYPGEGERLVAAMSFRGALVLFKYPTGIYVLNTTDPQPANWVLTVLTRAVGTLNQHSVVQIEADTLYLDRIGNIHSLVATDTFGDVTTSDIGDSNDISPFMRTTMNMDALGRIQAIWYPSKNQAWFAMSRLGTSDNDFRFIVSFEGMTQQGPVPKFFMSRRDICISLWVRPDADNVPRPVFGDAAGFIWLADQESRLKDGVGYPVRFETSNMDLAFLDPSLATRWKTGQFLELCLEPVGDWDLTVEVYWDDLLTDTVQFPMIAGGAPLGQFELDTDTLGSTEVRSIRKRIAGSGRRIKIIGSNEGDGQDILVSDFYLSFVVGDERTA